MTHQKIKNLFQVVYEACQGIKAEDVSALDLTEVGSYADYLLTVSGNSDRQIRAIIDQVIEDAFKKCQVHPLGIEGYETAQWVLVDFGDVVCHVFMNDIRSSYHLEDMWPQKRPLRGDQIKAFFLAKKTPVKPVRKKRVVGKTRVVRK